MAGRKYKWICYEDKFANVTKQVLPDILFDDKKISLNFDVGLKILTMFKTRVVTL